MNTPRKPRLTRPPEGLTETQACQWQSDQARQMAAHYAHIGNNHRASEWTRAADGWLKQLAAAGTPKRIECGVFTRAA